MSMNAKLGALLFLAVVAGQIELSKQSIRRVPVNWERLVEQNKRSLIVINKEVTFRKLVVEPQDQFASFVLINKNARHGCENCKASREILGHIAKQYALLAGQYGWKRVLFCEMFHDDLPELVDQLGITNFPALFYFPKEGRLRNVIRIENNEIHFKFFEKVLTYVEETADIQLPRRSGLTSTFDAVSDKLILFLLCGAFLIDWKSAKQWKLMFSPVFTVFLAICFVSGHVYNFIAHSIFIGHGFFMNSRRGQYHVEAYIMFFLYSMHCLGIILMTDGRKMYLTGKDYKKSETHTLTGIALASSSYLGYMLATKIKVGY